MSATMRTHRFSQSPWRYERCVVNALDLDIEISELTQFKPNKPKIIHRVVVNNQTLTIFGNYNYESIMFAANLKDVNIELATDSPNCCIITSTANS
jgi:hypothetical protein